MMMYLKQVKNLSGGERGRVSLAKLMLSDANFLLLDEPTNHLDIDSKEILEHAINNFEGTILYVSHDRYFINTTATRIINLTQKQIVSYPGNYDYYLEKRRMLKRHSLLLLLYYLKKMSMKGLAINLTGSNKKKNRQDNVK